MCSGLPPAQVVGQHNYATWAEYSKYERLQKLRHEITALSMAIDDMKTERYGNPGLDLVH